MPYKMSDGSTSMSKTMLPGYPMASRVYNMTCTQCYKPGAG